MRLIHGLSTAILGPVTLYYVVRISHYRRTENIGWFGTSRTLSYMLAPTVVRFLLLSLSPAQVYMASESVAAMALLILIALPSDAHVKPPSKPKRKVSENSLTPILAVAHNQTIWIVGGIEGFMYVVVYTIKAFMPVYALSAGFSIITVAGFFFNSRRQWWGSVSSSFRPAV